MHDYFYHVSFLATSASAISFAKNDWYRNIYYGTLYAYTPEVLPTAHRSTGNGIAVGFNRIMGLVSTIIGSVSFGPGSPL